MKNRLKLNFQLETAEERAAFVNSYLPTLTFTPNDHELNTLSNYLLWGKNEAGRNPQQEKLIELKKWAPTSTDSIEGLLEIPGFQESAFRTLKEPQQKVQRTTFNRQTALQNAPDHIKEVYRGLFREIDTVELTLNLYELEHGKRTKPPRTSLLKSFSDEEVATLQERASKLNQYKYLKLRHLLVELRSEQYNYFDMYSGKILPHGESINNVAQPQELSIGVDVQVRPVGLWYDDALSQKLFSNTPPDLYTPKELQRISDIIWEKRQDNALDFCNEHHILSLYQMRETLQEEADRDPDGIYSAAARILKTLQFYEDAAHLNDLQKEVLELKLCKTSNIMIADYINKKYGKTYNDNYISTIFHRKIIHSIAVAAQMHEKTIQNIFYPENFKVCRDCGRILLLDPNNFVKQKKSSDGYAPRCKHCEKIKREKRKLK